MTQIILEEYDKYMKYTTTDEVPRRIINTMRKKTNEINRIATSDLKNNFAGNQDSLNKLCGETENLRKELEKLALGLMPTIAEKWPAIFAKIVADGIERETLVHVLNTFASMQSGKINEQQALNSGKQYMTTAYNLPKDFFNK